MSKRQRNPNSQRGATAHQLRAFCEIAKTENISAAAAALDISVPTTLKQLRTLETEIGCSLVERSGRGSMLTAEGRVLAELAESVVRDIGSLKQRFMERCRIGGEKLTVVATSRILLEDVLPCLEPFQAKHPASRVVVREAAADQALQLIRDREADLAFLLDPCSGKRRDELADFSIRPAYSLDILLLMPAGHPLAVVPKITSKHLADCTFVSRFSPNSSDHAPSIFPPDIDCRTPSAIEAFHVVSVRRFVALGYGVAIIAGRIGHNKDASVVERSLNHLVEKPWVASVRQKKSEKAGSQFESFLRSACERPH